MSDLLLSMVRLGLPILFAAYGGLLSERGGIANIALEAGLLVSAFAAAATLSLSGNLVLATAAGVAASTLLSLLFAAICIWGRGDQIVVGTAINLLSLGIIPVLGKALFGMTGSTPPIKAALTYHNIWPFAFLALAMLFALDFLFRKTRFGLRVHVAGENPEVLDTQGVRSELTRLAAVTLGGASVAVGGIYLSLCQGSGFVREMAGGRGFIALAAVILGGWRPWPTFAACLFFALADAAGIQLQGREFFGFTPPDSLVQIFPYAITVLILAFYTRPILPPKAINLLQEK